MNGALYGQLAGQLRLSGIFVLLMSTVSVSEGETGVRVEAASPHLVSLGGSRLSTSVTIHRLSEGTTTHIGSGRDVDIAIQGPNVEKRHCSVIYENGVISLVPFAEHTTVDGVQINQSTTLTQGCIIGLGTSCFFRFNHPAQAKMIKKSLPEAKSPVLPLTFYQDAIDGHSPHHHQESRSRDALIEVTQFLAKEFSNGDIKKNGDWSNNSPKKSLPSPGYNRDPSPYFSQKPPRYSSQSSKDAPVSESNSAVKSSSPTGGSGGGAAGDGFDSFGVDEILAVCSEYERQAALERRTPPVQVRIKTNGSLPRDKRLHSPSSPLARNFTFDVCDFSLNDKETERKDSEKKKAAHTYENVNFASGSPRPRIKTYLGKEPKRDRGSPSPTNKIPLVLDLPIHQHTYSNLPCMSNGVPEEKRLSSTSTDTGSNGLDRPKSITESSNTLKYSFLGYDPRRVPSSPPSWTNPKLELDFPDYESCNGRLSDGKLDDDATSSRDSRNIDLSLALTAEKELIMKRQAVLKAKVSELERQEEELVRESSIEEALVSGEIAALEEKISQEESRVALLKERTEECESATTKCLAQQNESQEHFKMVSDKHTSIIETLERNLASCTDPPLKAELKESLNQQLELLDAERKSHELLEFQLLEEEAGWLSKREDLQRETQEITERLEARRIKLTTLKRAKTPNLGNQLEVEKISHLKSIEEGRTRLKEINEDLAKISNATDTLTRHQMTTSQDDLDRISKVTSGAPMDIKGSSNSLGRRTIASLQEIERNRQLHLVKQGSLVIQEERQRVEDLKKRVADEVKAQWHQQRNSNCQSIVSATSDDSSLEPTRDSGVSSEEVEKGLPSSEDGKNEECTTSRDESAFSGTPESRPLSDASGYSDEQTSIKKRSKSSSNIQRPLTRYLPIKSETLDLRSHIESAGHQIDLCSHVFIDSFSCRGYLQKMGSGFRPRWNKRWFVFDRQARTFTYYADKNENKPRGGAYFQAIEEVYVDHTSPIKAPAGGGSSTFVVKSSSRTYSLMAPTPEAMRIWVDVIITGAEGYQLYVPH